MIGDVYALGKVTIKGNFILYPLDKGVLAGIGKGTDAPNVSLADEPATPDIDESLPEHHGIFIYDIPEVGTGSLEIVGSLNIGGISAARNPKIHTFVPYPSITGTAADKIFCADRDLSNNICTHWTTSTRVWVRQSTAGGE
jgi:hypothetical protein